MEIHGYTQHGCIEATIDGTKVTVPDDMSNRHRRMIAGWEAKGNSIPAYVAPDIPQPYRLYKSTIIRRLSEQEAANLSSVLNGAPARSRMLWEASEWLASDDPLFGQLEQAVGEALGAERAAELLAPVEEATK